MAAPVAREYGLRSRGSSLEARAPETEPRGRKSVVSASKPRGRSASARVEKEAVERETGEEAVTVEEKETWFDALSSPLKSVLARSSGSDSRSSRWPGASAVILALLAITSSVTSASCSAGWALLNACVSRFRIASPSVSSRWTHRPSLTWTEAGSELVDKLNASLPDSVHGSALLLLFLAWIVQRDGRGSVMGKLRCLAWCIAVTLSGSIAGGVYILVALIDAHPRGRLDWPRFWMGGDAASGVMTRASSPARTPHHQKRR